MKIRSCSVISIIVSSASLFTAYAETAPRIQPDVVYGHKDGMALTFDAIYPEKPNGAGVLLIQSGGWYSGWSDPMSKLPVSEPFLEKGFTVFIVYHGSAPRFRVPDAVADVRRCVRYIRLHAKDLGVDAERLGVQGSSAGGHLSLMLGTTADAGDPKAKDPVLRQSDRIAAVVALCPPTDLRQWPTNPPDAVKRLPHLLPGLAFPEEKSPDVSPLLHVTPDDAAILLIHGDKDELVPIGHSQNILAALEKEKVATRLLVIEGAGHGFSKGQIKNQIRPAMVEWFEKQLAAKKPEKESSSN